MYNLCGKERLRYYLKVRDTQVWLISCLLDSNRNSVGEFVLVSSNWYANDLAYLTSPRDIGQYHSCWTCFYYIILYSLFMIIFMSTYMLIISTYSDADGKKFKPDINAVHVRASHLILGCTLVYTSYQDPG